MARLKSLDFKLSFETKYSSNPIEVSFGTKKEILKQGKSYFDLSITDINQIEEIEFKGFVPEDKEQRVLCCVEYLYRKLDSVSLCTFIMQDNLYVANKKLRDYNNIHFNGKLTIRFFKEWFEHNICSGMILNKNKKGFLGWANDYYSSIKYDRLREKELSTYDTICMGASFTHGTKELCPKQTWPYYLQTLTGETTGNFGVPGIDQYSILHNVEHVLKNFEVKKVIILFPDNFIPPFRLHFLNYFLSYLSLHMWQGDLKKKYSLIQNYDINKHINKHIKRHIVYETLVYKFINSKILSIKKKFNKIDFKIIYQHSNTKKHKHIDDIILPFSYPDIKLFPTISDGHPSGGHNKMFAEMLFKYIKIS